MKKQIFRFKLLAVMLAVLIALAFFYGISILPPAESAGSLREAILQLTGPEHGSTLSSLVSPEASSSVFPDSAASSKPSPSPSSPPASDASPPPQGSVLPFAEAISQYFSSSSAQPETTPSDVPAMMK